MESALVLVGFAGLAALVVKLIDFVRLVSAMIGGDKTQGSAIVTQVLVWAAGIAGVLLFAASDLGNTVDLTDSLTLDSVNLATKVLVGIMLGSAGSLFVDAKQAIDNGDTAVKPPLGGGPGEG